MKAHALFDGCSLTFKDEKPSLTCELFDSIKLDVDLTCSICLVSFSILDEFASNLMYLNITVVPVQERSGKVK